MLTPKPISFTCCRCTGYVNVSYKKIFHLLWTHATSNGKKNVHILCFHLLVESARQYIIMVHGDSVWKCIVHELQLPSETFELSVRYDGKLLFNICECMVHLVRAGTVESYLNSLGQDFVRFFVNFGFYKIIRVAGRTFRDFLLAIDQLHDSNRYTFPRMHQPLFLVTDETETGVTLVYKSVRHGFMPYASGAILGAAKTLFQEDIKIDILYDSSTKDYAHVVFWVAFDNKRYQIKPLANFPSLPNLSGATIFRVFPFSILIDSSLRIYRVGRHLMRLFSSDTILVGRSLDEVFRLIRPDIHVEWNKILSYGRHIVFLMESRLPLRVGGAARIRLKGQMKYIQHQNILWFLCHPVLASADDMISAGLHLNDLNLFDSTSDLLITAMQQERAIEDAIEKQQMWIRKSQETKNTLIQWRKKSQRLLYSILPKHIAVLLQSGVQPNCICESHPLVTVLFTYLIDFKTLTVELDPAQIITHLNEIIETFDRIDEEYDVFKVETKADASYMVVAGLSDRSHIGSLEYGTSKRVVFSDSRDEVDDDITEKIDKNPLRLHQTEIIALLALDLLDASRNIINPVTKEPFNVKFGFHSGPAVGGIVGKKNIQYCLFGDTINMASRITTSGESGRIHITHSAYGYLASSHRFNITYRGQIEIKGKGIQPAYWLTSRTQKPLLNVINKTQTQLRCPFSGGFNENFENYRTVITNEQ